MMSSKGTLRGRGWWVRLSRANVVPAVGVIGILGAVGLALMGGSWFIAYIVLHPPTQTTGETPADARGLSYSDVSFPTADGLVLRGWYIPGKNGATVILVHGFARDRTELLPEACWLAEHDFGVLLFDLRAQGSSDGTHISFGLLEALDVRAAVDFVLGGRPEERIGVIGYSMGAVAGILAAAEDTRLQAVIAVSPFATLREAVNCRLGHARPLAALIIWCGERMTGLRLDNLRPVDIVARLSPRPILILQAEGDSMVPPDSGQRLYEAAAEPKELWSVPGAAHVDFRQTVQEAYQQRLIDFFERYLLFER